MSVEDLAVVAKLYLGTDGVDMLPEDELSLGKKAWLESVVRVLNSMWAAPHFLTFNETTSPSWPGLRNSKPKANQQEALRLLAQQVSEFLLDDSGEPLAIESKDWEREPRKKRIDYSGHVVSHAVPFTWELVEPALPAVGMAARVDVMQLAEDPIAGAQSPSPLSAQAA